MHLFTLFLEGIRRLALISIKETIKAVEDEFYVCIQNVPWFVTMTVELFSERYRHRDSRDQDMNTTRDFFLQLKPR